MKTKGIDIKLNVQPIYIGLVHKYVFEGPCRFGQGDELTEQYEVAMNAELFKEFSDNMKRTYGSTKEINMFEPIYVERYDDLLTPAGIFDTMAGDIANTDLYVVGLEIARGDLLVEFAERTRKPVAIVPENCCMIGDCLPALKARNLEAYGYMTWDDGILHAKALRLRKVMKNMTVLGAPRFNSNNAIASDATFYSQNDVTMKLGTHFRFISIHELIDQHKYSDPMGNPTTPGRMGQNLTEEEEAEVDALTNELIDNAEYSRMTFENLRPSVKMYRLVKKMLDLYNANAFVAPCPDGCATRRLNEERFTFCLTHSLLNEEGIPSACEYDVGALLSMMLLNNLGEGSAYMGNTNPLQYNDKGEAIPQRVVFDDDLKDIKNEQELVYTFHSTPNRALKSYAKKEPYGIAPFAYSGWGGTIRYDFKKDAGQVITMCRFSPKCDKLFISRGVIKGGSGYNGTNCDESVIFQVANARDFFMKQIYGFGNHIPLCYGDYTDVLIEYAKSAGLEPVVSL